MEGKKRKKIKRAGETGRDKEEKEVEDKEEGIRKEGEKTKQKLWDIFKGEAHM